MPPTDAVEQYILEIIESYYGDQDDTQPMTPVEDLTDYETSHLLSKIVEGNNEEKPFDGVEKIVEAINNLEMVDSRERNRYVHRTLPSFPLGSDKYDSESIARINVCFLPDGVDPTRADIAVPMRLRLHFEERRNVCIPLGYLCRQYFNHSCLSQNNNHMHAGLEQMLKDDARRIFTIAVGIIVTLISLASI